MTRLNRKGMTLIEVVVAMGILGLIAALTWSAIASTIMTRDVLANNDKVQQSARVAMARITRELEMAFLVVPTAATTETYRTVFVGKDNSPMDELWFATMAHQRLYRGARECDQAEVTLWGEPDPTRDGLNALMHRESQRIDHEPDKDGVIYPLAYGVKALTLRYLDGKTCEWNDEWDSTSAEQSNTLPRAVQIVLTIMGPDPDDDEKELPHTFATTVMLEYAAKASCDPFGGEQQ